MQSMASGMQGSPGAAKYVPARRSLRSSARIDVKNQSRSRMILPPNAGFVS